MKGPKRGGLEIDYRLHGGDRVWIAKHVPLKTYIPRTNSGRRTLAADVARVARALSKIPGFENALGVLSIEVRITICGIRHFYVVDTCLSEGTTKFVEADVRRDNE